MNEFKIKIRYKHKSATMTGQLVNTAAVFYLGIPRYEY